MKVFEVRTEHFRGDSTEIVTELQYVTSEDNTLKSVFDHFTEHCEQYEKTLLGVRQVLTIVQHLKKRD
jgi:hypothetical protein